MSVRSVKYPTTRVTKGIAETRGFGLMPRDGPESAEFSLTVLKLASAFKDAQLITAPSGIQFSPALSQQR